MVSDGGGVEGGDVNVLVVREVVVVVEWTASGECNLNGTGAVTKAACMV